MPREKTGLKKLLKRDLYLKNNKIKYFVELTGMSFTIIVF
jgi:hypothetical protein